MRMFAIFQALTEPLDFGFQDRPVRPLRHPSNEEMMKYELLKYEWKASSFGILVESYLPITKSPNH